MQVTRLSIYPIKGTREVSLDVADVRPQGLVGDRRWMVVDAAGQFLQQRVLPSMALLEVTLKHDGSLAVTAPGMTRLSVAVPRGQQRKSVTVWRDQVNAADAGPEAAEWFSKYLGRTCHLVHMDQESTRPVAAEYGQAGDVVSFADAAPLLLATDASLVDLNTRMAKPLPMSRFRPNVTIDGEVSWAEDRWKRIRIGELEFEVTHACARCVVTTIDQETGVKQSDGEPLKTLAAFRRGDHGIYFGQNLIPRTFGTIHLGDRVTVVRHRVP